MRKKKIIEQNAVLFEQVEKLRRQVDGLSAKLKEAELEITRLNEENRAAQDTAADGATPLEKIEEKVILAAPQFNASDYGAKAIGKIVLAASKISSSFSGDSGAGKIEMLNLILGKAEVSKAEILSAVSSERSDKEKKMAVDGIVIKTQDYFDKIISGER